MWAGAHVAVAATVGWWWPTQISVAVAGALAGAQWCLLRRRVDWAGSWSLAVVVAGAARDALGVLFGPDTSNPVLLGSAVASLLPCLVLWGEYGGRAAAWLLVSPVGALSAAAVMSSLRQGPVSSPEVGFVAPVLFAVLSGVVGGSMLAWITRGDVAPRWHGSVADEFSVPPRSPNIGPAAGVSAPVPAVANTPVVDTTPEAIAQGNVDSGPKRSWAAAQVLAILAAFFAYLFGTGLLSGVERWFAILLLSPHLTIAAAVVTRRWRAFGLVLAQVFGWLIFAAGFYLGPLLIFTIGPDLVVPAALHLGLALVACWPRSATVTMSRPPPGRSVTNPVFWIVVLFTVPALVFLPLFLRSLQPNASVGPNLRAAYFFAMLAAIPCGPMAVLIWLGAVVARRTSWAMTVVALVAAAGTYAAIGRTRFWF